MYWGKNMNVTSIPFTWAQWIPLSAVLRPGGKFNTFWIRLGFLCWTESCINSLVMSLRITLSHSLIKQGFLKAWTCPRLNVFLSSRPPSGLVPIPSRYFRLFGIPLQKSIVCTSLEEQHLASSTCNATVWPPWAIPFLSATSSGTLLSKTLFMFICKDIFKALCILNVHLLFRFSS